jgi:hypothetical protein
MSQVRDLFFDEFYAELMAVAEGIQASEDEPGPPPALADELLRRWTPHLPDPDNRPDTLISVDGGVQHSQYAYGGFVAVARALALTHTPGQQPRLTKTVKIHVQDVYDNRDRVNIPSYARTIAEYRAATQAAEEALQRGLTPLVVLDGSLYMARFPYAVREYIHHPGLLAELFTAIAGLRHLSRDRGFPLAAVSKDSSVFYLHMQLLKEAAQRAGLGRLAPIIAEASSPPDLRIRMERWAPGDRASLQPLLDPRPQCDTRLVDLCAPAEGYTHPLLLAPSIYYGRDPAPSLYSRIRRSIPPETAEAVVTSLQAFFGSPGVAVTYWRPRGDARPFRVDLAASSLGHPEPWIEVEGDAFLEPDHDPEPLKRTLNHLAHWYCNDVEYNLPLKQADTLARFDRALYTSKYEPFIVRRLEEAGLDIRGTRRALREVG